jgi:ligand-binding sensor protein
MFATAHSVAIVVVDRDGNTITNPSNFPDLFTMIGETQKGRDHCEMFERMLAERALNSMIPVCEVFPGCGFIDAVVPVEIDGQYIATLKIGHVFVTDIDVRKLESYAGEIGADPGAFVAAARRMRMLKPEQFEHLLDLFSQTAEKLLTLSYYNLKQAVDITERTKMIQSLQESKEKYHELSKVLLGRFPAKQKDEILSSLRDVTERKRLDHERTKALDQIDYILEQLLILNDSIRNPLTVIVAYADLMEDTRARQILLDQAKEIDIIINKLDQRCLESEKVREYLRKHFKDF